MQRLSGVLMVLAGSALGGYMVLPAPQSGAGSPAEVVHVVAAPNQPDRDFSGASNPSAASAGAAAVTAASGKSPTADTRSDTRSDSGARVFSPATPLAAGTSTWTAVVTSEPAAQGKMSSPRPGDSETRAALAGDLQRELKRVGCYGGEITGTWTPSTKRAMSAFMERVNATLPVEQPDYILLTLVQGHAAIACGADCPSGQAMSAAGRCVPNAVVAQASRKSQRDDERRANELLKAQQQERFASEQRAADAKRIADATKRADAARVAAAIVPPAPKPAVRILKPQQTAALEPKKSEPEQLPWLNDNAATKPAAPATVASVDGAASSAELARATPPPGMMSIGGPRVITPELPASAAAVTPGSGPRPAGTLGVTLDSPALSTSTDGVASARASVVRKTLPVVRQAALAGLPGTKAGPAYRPASIAGLPGTKAGPAYQRPAGHVNRYVYRPAKIVRRPPPVVVYASPKPKYYASNSGGKVRRGQPRPGTMQYNVMHSLGGIY